MRLVPFCDNPINECILAYLRNNYCLIQLQKINHESSISDLSAFISFASSFREEDFLQPYFSETKTGLTTEVTILEGTVHPVII